MLELFSPNNNKSDQSFYLKRRKRVKVNDRKNVYVLTTKSWKSDIK